MLNQAFFPNGQAGNEATGVGVAPGDQCAGVFAASRVNRANRLRRGALQKGFTLVEVIVVLALVGVAMVGVLMYQAMAEQQNRANAAVNALISMVGTTKSIFAPANTFAAVSTPNLINAGVPVAPFTSVGTAIQDPWGGTMEAGGSPAFFGFSLAMPDRDTCMAIAAAMAPASMRTVATAGPATWGTSATTVEAFLPGTGAAVIKANAAGTYDPAAASTQCALPNIRLHFAFR